MGVGNQARHFAWVSGMLDWFCPMRLLVISSAYPPLRAGESEYAFHLCERLAKLPLELHLLTTERPGRLALEGATTHALDIRWAWGDMPSVARVLRGVSPDAILFLYIGWLYGYQPMPTYLPWLAKRVAPSATFVTLMYNRYGAAIAHNSNLTQLVRKLFSLGVGQNVDSCYEFGTLLTSSDRLVVFAQKHFDFLRSVEPGIASRTDLIPPPPLVHVAAPKVAARARGRASLGLADDVPLVGFFGLLYRGKGIETLVRAIARVRDSHPEARLVLIGDELDAASGEGEGYAELLRSLVASLELGPSVIWSKGYASEESRASELLHACDVVALPFDVGIALNNSSVAGVAAHEIPIVSTRPEALESAFQPGENVLLVPPKDHEALAEAIASVLSDPARRARLAGGAARLARDWFSWERALPRLLDALNIPIESRTRKASS